MTADHVLATDVLLSDGTRRSLGRSNAARLTARPQRPAWKARSTGAASLVESPANQEIIHAGTPRHWRRCGGYNLDRLIPDAAIISSARQPVQPRQSHLRRRGYAGGDARDQAQPGAPAPRPRWPSCILTSSTPRSPPCPPSWKPIPRPWSCWTTWASTICREVPEYARLLSILSTASRTACSSPSFTARREAELPPRSTACDHLQEHNGCRPRACSIARTRSSSRRLDRAQGGPGPADEHPGRPQAHSLHRRRRGAGGTSGRIRDPHRGFLPRARQPRGLLRPCQRRLRAHSAAHQHQGGQRRRQAAADHRLLGRAPGRLRRRPVQRAWRRARPQLGQRVFLRPRLYGLYQQVKQIFDPHNILQSGQRRRRRRR